MKFKIQRCDMSGSLLEDLGIMTTAEFKEYAGSHFVGTKVGTYPIIFKTKTELNNVLKIVEENHGDTWLLGRNPETQQGEQLMISEVPAEEN